MYESKNNAKCRKIFTLKKGDKNMTWDKKRKFDLKGKNIKIPIMIVLALLLLQALVGTMSFSILFNLTALQIIFAGIFISVFISFSMEVLINTINLIRASFTEEINYDDTIHKIYDLTIKIKKKGLLSIQKDIELEEDIFLKDTMILLNDYKRPEAMEDIIDNDIDHDI